MSSIPPVVPNLPAATTSLTNKYAAGGQYTGQSAATLIQLLNSLPTPRGRAYRPATTANTITPLTNFDIARARRGQPPLTARQSALALETLATGQPATPPRRQGFFKSALGDLRSLVGSAFQLPGALVNEAKQLPDLPTNISAALGRADNPLEAIGELATVPGLRMIPGAFTAEQLFAESGQGVQGLMAHPLFTALDLLPAASGAAASTKVVRAAREAYPAQIAALTDAAEAAGHVPGSIRTPRAPRALPTALTRKLDSTGAIVPNRAGRAAASTADAFKATRTGNVLYQMFGERNLPRLEGSYTSDLRAITDPTTPADLIPTRLGNVDVTPEIAAYKRAVDVRASTAPDRLDIAPERVRELSDLATNPRDASGNPLPIRTDPSSIPGLLPNEIAYLSAGREAAEDLARLQEGDLTQSVMVNGRNWVYDMPTARRLTRYQSRASHASEVVDARALLTDEAALSRLTPDDLAAKIDSLDSPASSYTKAQRDHLRKLYESATDDLTALRAAPDRANLVPIAIDALGGSARTSGTLGRLLSSLKQSRWSDAVTDLTALKSRNYASKLPIDLDALTTEVRRLRDHNTTLKATSSFTPRRAATFTRRARAAESRTPPDVLSSALQANADKAITAKVKELYTGSPDLEEMIQLASERIYDPISHLSGNDVRILQREARQGWQALVDAGLDPIFYARTTPAAATRMSYPRVLDVNITPKAAVRRTMDAAPYVHDMGVGLESAALDLLQRRGTRAFLDEFTTSYGRPRATLVSEFLPRARARAEANPSLSLQSHLATLIEARYVPWDEAKYAGGAAHGLGALPVEGADQLWVPRAMAENMARMYSPPLPKLTSALQGPMHVFRTSVLPLAGRWHVNNAVGNMVTIAVTDPRAFLEAAPIIRSMWENRSSKILGGKPGAIGADRAARAFQPKGAPPSGLGGMVDPEVRAWDQSTKFTDPLRDRVMAASNYKMGETLRRWTDSAANGRVARAKDAGSKFVQGSYNLNQVVDDFGRAVIGTSAKKRALRQGFTEGASDAVAVGAIRRAFQAWDELTPLERSVGRTIVPFYSFCVDRETQALTKRGWVDGWDLSEDDTILSMDPNTKELKWSSVKSIYRNPDYSGPMYHLHNRTIDALVTPHHKFATSEGILKEVEDLRQIDKLQIMGSAVDGPTIYDDAFVELVGWAVTEGHYKRNRSGNTTTIEISQKDSGQHTPRIREVLKRSGARWHEFLAGVDHKIRYFGVTGELRRQIMEVAPERVMTMEFVCSINAYQRDLLIQTMLDADGSVFTHHETKTPYQTITFSQKDRRASEVFAILCTMAGRPTLIRPDTSPNRVVDSWIVGVRKLKVTQVVTMRGWTTPGAPFVATPPQVHYEGLVWCPETEYGTFVCRRNGVVHVTGNTSHILRYVSQYPFDHPLRVGVFNSFARAELTDAMTGLPDYIRQMVFLGDPRANGVTKALNLNSMNPFNSVPDMFTTAGFLGMLNPILTGVLESVGIDTLSGGPVLYPEMEYDPETGRLVANPSGNLASNILGNLVPGLDSLTALAGHNESYRALLASDPEAARRRLLSGLGLPNLIQNIDVGKKLIGAELARAEDQESARKKALTTGNLGILDDFPGLAAYGEQVRALEAAGLLDQLRPAADANSGASAAYAVQAAL